MVDAWVRVKFLLRPPYMPLICLSEFQLLLSVYLRCKAMSTSSRIPGTAFTSPLGPYSSNTGSARLTGAGSGVVTAGSTGAVIAVVLATLFCERFEATASLTSR